MFVVHLTLMVLAAVVVAATSACNGALRRRGRELPLMGYIIGSALIVGNSASLMESAPTWYRVVMITVSVAGFTWLAFSIIHTDNRNNDAETASRDIYSGLVPTRTVPPRPQLRVVHATVINEADGTDTDTGHSARPSATQETFHANSPAGSRAATGPTYVAAHISDYIDTGRTRRAHGRFVARTHNHTDPTERFLRLAEVYSVDRPRSLGRSARS